MYKKDIFEVVDIFDSVGFEVLSFNSQEKAENNYVLEIDLEIIKKSNSKSIKNEKTNDT